MIIHLDADAFYASCEQAADARLRGKVMAVGGSRRGIIASASYEARRLGIYTPMATTNALRMVPGLILVKGRFERYEWFSRRIFEFIEELTPYVERTSIDEGYFRLAEGDKRAPLTVAQELQEKIERRLRVTVSFGIASNKLISQIVSKLKKPRGLAVVESGDEAEFLAPLDVKWLPGVGGRTEAALKAAGFHRIEQVRAASQGRVAAVVGDYAPKLLQYATGIDDRPLVVERGEALSYSHQETFGANTADRGALERTMKMLLDDLIRQVVDDEKSVRTVAVRVRLEKMQDTERSESLAEPSSLAEDFYPLVERLLHRAWDGRAPVRLVAVRLSNVYDGVIAGDLFTREEKGKRLALQKTMHDLQRRYGDNAIMRGHSCEG